ncbi:siderophore-interacting protein [Alteromonas sp. H39]|uniref:siderophore-interacting protein n=1 Tax=Alteromonas sp. H39 TaxID=3389876 RepID=UPI0039E1B125
MIKIPFITSIFAAKRRLLPSKGNAFPLTVQRSVRLSASVQRVTLGGKAVRGLTGLAPGSYIKLLFDSDGAPITGNDVLSHRPQLRTYTIRQCQPQQCLLDIDIAIHENNAGPGARWAQQVKIGEQILIRGPGSIKPLHPAHDWLLFAGDLTSLPAIASHLESLPETANGDAFIQIPHQDDIISVKHPPGIAVHWLVEGADDFAEKVSEVAWRPGQPFVWIACEFSLMRRLRAFFKVEKGLPNDFLYVSSYWRRGRSEEQHKADKRRDLAILNAVNTKVSVE